MMSLIDGTPLYQAPETFKVADVEFKGYTKSVDYYSLSLILFELYTGEQPYPPVRNLFDVIKLKNQNHVPEKHEKLPDELWPFVSRGYSRNPTDRPSPAEFKAAIGEYCIQTLNVSSSYIFEIYRNRISNQDTCQSACNFNDTQSVFDS
jgi:serine/threonine protein kinase